jgi:L-alanine-DL-glutamate epimerase-like enolase superfamily enzyme
MTSNPRRDFLLTLAAAPLAAALPSSTVAASPSAATSRNYGYLGRVDGYRDHALIDRGLTIEKIESFVQGGLGLVRLTTQDGRVGWGQLAPLDPKTAAIVLHDRVARHAIGQDAADIDAICDRVIDANMKMPWSYVCRALSGVDTALWDLYGRVRGVPVCELLGAKAADYLVYGSSQRRDISPEEEGRRCAALRDSMGITAFKVRLGVPTGHNRDAAPGRSEKIIPTMRAAVGPATHLMADANSCYTPDRAIAFGRRLEDQNYLFFEEPCPYWELEWTQEVTSALSIPVAGGEQDNDMAQWRRMIRMGAVDIFQPDPCYVGGFTRMLRVAQMAQVAGRSIEPHSANLSLVTVFCQHLLLAIPNAAPHLEFSIEFDSGLTRQAREMFSPALTIRNGKSAIPAEGPGWGVTINPAWLAGATYQKTERSDLPRPG